MPREFGSCDLLIGVRPCQNIAAFENFLTYRIVNMLAHGTILMYY